ncbi:hypothetical protein SKAU_G00193490 [Synaphobranchus kaupii]|uniref:Uncharacterized protein n=1 Tax=Synaphobranchus kaupii TaxID=118154 RepID=A0A9Q1FEE3_SYNKA|nr:hypothetical protein SKAU_G00193490 [Synaphobranchus kaupii]
MVRQGEVSIGMRELDMSVENLARVFQVKAQTLYMVNSTSGVVDLPVGGEFPFHNLDYGSTYFVEGVPEDNFPAPVPPPAAQQWSVPPSRRSASLVLVAAPAPRMPYAAPKQFPWSIFLAKREGNSINLEGGVVNVLFTEESATVEGIAALVKRSLAMEANVVLTDAGGRMYSPAPGTSASNSSVLDEVQSKIVEVVLAVDSLPAVVANIREAANLTTGLTRDQRDSLRSTFVCTICQGKTTYIEHHCVELYLHQPNAVTMLPKPGGMPSVYEAAAGKGARLPKCRGALNGGMVEVAGLSDALNVVRTLTV